MLHSRYLFTTESAGHRYAILGSGRQGRGCSPATGFSALERTTGFAAVIVSKTLARKEIAPGVRTPERAVLAAPFYKALQARWLKISCS